MNRRKLLISLIATPILSCSQGEKVPQTRRVNVDEDFFDASKRNYIGVLDGKMCFNYILEGKILSLVPSENTIGLITIKKYPGLDSLALSYTGDRTSSGPIYQIDELIYASPDSTSKK